MKRIVITIAASLFALGAVQAQEAARNMGELLELIEQGKARDSAEARQRLAEFQQQRNQQQQLLNQARAERTRLENESTRLENAFASNQQAIIDARAQLDQRLGALKELFGVLQTVTGDAQGRFNQSLTNIQYPNRAEFLVELGGKMAGASSLASIDEIERLWFELQREVAAQGKIVRFTHEFANAQGERVTDDIVRVGVFNIVFEDGYLQYDPSTDNISELQRQPEQSRYTDSTETMVNSQPGEIVRFGLDVTRGSILSLLVESPTLGERIDQGGIVGYTIIGLGIIGLLIAIWRMISLTIAGNKVRAQLKRDSASTDNPLGRVLAAYENNKNADTETIELKLSEAALKEMPGLTKGLFIKVISVVSPLMGLLGTVTGMIQTFQVITLYGAGDPKMMAGGISQALMTTVLGLCVAIPMVLIHTLVSGQSRKIINILNSQSAGIVAQHSEKHG